MKYFHFPKENNTILRIVLIVLFPLILLSNSWRDSISSSINDYPLQEFSVYIVNHGWHTGVIMERNPFLFYVQEDSALFPKGKWLEFGWGDHDFYMSTPTENDVQWFTMIKAFIFPTRSVIHVVGFNESPPDYFSYSELIGLDIPDSLRKAMYNFVANAFYQNKNGHINFLGSGLYGDSRFFNGREVYCFPRTCNVWTARTLEQGGIDLGPYSCQKSNLLMDRLSSHGVVLHRLKGK